MGRGAQNGIIAAPLAQADFDTGIRPIEYWGKLVSQTLDTSFMANELGKEWDLLQNIFKPYPCGIVVHPLIDGEIEAHHTNVKYDQVKRIEVVVNPQCVRLYFIQHPKTFLEAIFSVNIPWMRCRVDTRGGRAAGIFERNVQ